MDGYVDKHLNTYKYVSLKKKLILCFFIPVWEKENTFHIMTIRIWLESYVIGNTLLGIATSKNSYLT
jgi:hypothetical protein